MEATQTPVPTPAPDTDSANDPMVIAGWTAVIFAPIIAVIIGFLLRGRGDRRGNPILAVSLTLCALGLIVTAIVVSMVTGAGSSSGGQASCAFDQSPTPAELQACNRQLDKQLRVP